LSHDRPDCSHRLADLHVRRGICCWLRGPRGHFPPPSSPRTVR